MKERAARDAPKLLGSIKRPRRSIRLSWLRKPVTSVAVVAKVISAWRAQWQISQPRKHTGQTADRLSQKIDRFVESLGHPRGNGDQP
jgi:hypothetical protein